MENQFIKLTSSSNKDEILIGVNHIAWVQSNKDGGTDVYMAIARGNDLFPKLIEVKEDYETVKRSLLL
jgi:hypothetical protein